MKEASLEMRVVFVVQHVRSEDTDDEDAKFIGVYSSQANAQKAVDRLKGCPGFCDWPEGFYISEYELDGTNWAEGFVSSN